MKAQRLKTLADFLKRAEIIPQALLVITHDDYEECYKAVRELRALNYDIPFYELNLSENPNLKEELAKHFDLAQLPTFVYFRGGKMLSQITGFSPINNISSFLTSAVYLNY